MTDAHSDALVFFGATGDLAYKKIFPALQAMIQRGCLDVPVIGVAKSEWNVEQLRLDLKARWAPESPRGTGSGRPRREMKTFMSTSATQLTVENLTIEAAK